jgi:hypothetical protein
MNSESESAKPEREIGESPGTAEELAPVPKNRETVFAQRALLAGAILLAAAWLYDYYEPAIRHPPGILIFEEPRQSELTGRSWTLPGGYRVETLATFSMRGLVLHTMRYTDDRAADLMPVDFVLGWGPMSDQRVLDRLTFDQSYRMYSWTQHDDSHIVPDREIIERSANMHMIPADDGVKAQLLAVKQGQIVSFEGELVQVTGPNRFFWRSSLSRTDSGPGGCELVRVRRLTVQE